MNILVIGGEGYIGTKLCEFLRKNELYFARVDVVDLKWYGSTSQTDTIFSDYNHLSKEFLSRYDAIIMLAAYASVSLSQKAGLQALKNDVMHFAELVQKVISISKNRRVKFIYASSGSVYGCQPAGYPSREDDLVNPVSFYDLCKRFNDDYVLQHLSGIEAYGLRFGTVNGFSPHLRTDIMINAMTQAAKSGNIICSCPEQYRAILSIDDLCGAVEMILKEPHDNRGIYNLASFNSSIKDIALTVAKHFNCSVILKEGHTPYSFSLDCSKFMRAYPYCGTFSSINSIIRTLQQKPVLTSVRNV